MNIYKGTLIIPIRVDAKDAVDAMHRAKNAARVISRTIVNADITNIKRDAFAATQASITAVAISRDIGV